VDKPSSLHSVLTDSIIRGLAGDLYYQRGVDYLRRNLVHSLEASGNVVEAVVSGTEDYGVTLSARGKRFTYTCECPVGAGGEFCKHCVATALAWLAGNAAAAPSQKSARTRLITDEDIEAALGAEDKQTLISWLIEWSQQDKPLRQRLATLARLKNDPAASVAQVRQQLQEAIRIRRYVDYNQAGAYAGRVDSAIDAVETLLQQGHAAPAIDLCEAAMKWLEGAIENVDDSDGRGTELMARIADLHLRACEKALPDPESLGVRLFALEMNGTCDQWFDTAGRYANLLGDKGLAAFREAAAKAWAKVPARTMRESNGESYYGVTRIMERLARQCGDVEQLVGVLERDLTFANQYLRIAEAYRNAGKLEKALDWAERGMAIYTNHEGGSLRRFVAEEYRSSQRHADALRIVWSEFRGAPSLAGYKLLEEFARAADDWDDWRDRAHTHIRRTLAEKPAAPKLYAPGGFPNALVFQFRRPQGQSLLVEIFLHEQNIDEAWREAQCGGCSDQLWLKLAAQREEAHPDDAIAVYLRLGEQAVAATTDGRYEPAVGLLEKAAALMHGLGRGAEFEVQFDALRQRFKVKRNLQKLAEARRQFLYLKHR